MTIWYKPIIEKLVASGHFRKVEVIGAKVRASPDPVRFLDIYFDPISGSYSYSLIDLNLQYPGDKRLFGSDDYPHEGITEIKRLPGYPHHFQRRAEDGAWIFEASSFRGNVADEVDTVIAVVAAYFFPGALD